MNVRKTTLVLLILLSASAFLARRQWALHQLRQQTMALAATILERESRMATVRQELEALQGRIAQEKRREGMAVADVARAERAFATADPESRWAEPPATTPDWNAESPFVWIRKEMVPKFGVSIFNNSGGLLPEAASVLAVDGSTLRSMNSQLEQLMTDYHALEVARAKLIDKPLPGTQGEGTKVTVEISPMPEEGGRFKTQFEAVLNAELGFQRASLVQQTAEGWLDQQFSGFGSEAKTISVLRDSRGNLNVSIHSGQSWFSTGVPTGRSELIEHYIPPHLLPLFKEVLTPSDAGASATQADAH